MLSRRTAAVMLGGGLGGSGRIWARATRPLDEHAAAAGAAAGDAAGAAAWAAARAAARAAAGDAAGAAARAAATKRLAPSVKVCQASALLLLDRMIEVGRDESAA